MLRPSFVFLGYFFLQFLYGVYAMDCPVPLKIGPMVSCPTIFNDDDKAFCCSSSDEIHYCCDIGEYIKQNSAIIAGILVGVLILLIIVTLCCCCFCSCCCLARRRTQRGTVLYAPVSPAPVVSLPPVSSPTYPVQSGLVVHAPPPSSQLPSPPPYPIDSYQPPVNPNYKY